MNTFDFNFSSSQMENLNLPSSFISLLKPVTQNSTYQHDQSTGSEFTFTKPSKKSSNKVTSKCGKPVKSQKKNTKTEKKEHKKDTTKRSCIIKIEASTQQTLIKETPVATAMLAQTPVNYLQSPCIKSKPISKLAQKASKEIQMILNLRKIRPSVRTIQLSHRHKAKRDSIKAKLQAMPKKNSLMVSIPLSNAKAQVSTPQNLDYVRQYIGTSHPKLDMGSFLPNEQISQKQASQSNSPKLALNTPQTAPSTEDWTNLLSQLAMLESPMHIPQTPPSQQVDNNVSNLLKSTPVNYNQIENTELPRIPQAHEKENIMSEEQLQELELLLQILMAQQKQ